MTPRPQAEIFIETLEEVRSHELAGRKARLRLQLKARVRRFVEGFRTGFDGSRHPLILSRKTGPRHEGP